MRKSDYKADSSAKNKKYRNSKDFQELLSVSSMEMSPERCPYYRKCKTLQSNNNPKSNFESEEPGFSKITSRTNTRGYSGFELESDSIYKGKMLGFEPKELSGGEGTSQKHESTLIDKEVKGRLRNSLAVHSRKQQGPQCRVKTSLTLSEDRRGDLFDAENSKYLSSGDYTEAMSKQAKKTMTHTIENIDEESAEMTSMGQISKEGRNSAQEHELREAFIENLREMVTGVFRDLREELQDSSERQLQQILQEKDKAAKLREKHEKGGFISEKAQEVLKIQDKMLVSLSNLLGGQLKQSNKVKGMLIDTLMFLDKQVLEVSKIQRVMDQRRNFPEASSKELKSSPSGGINRKRLRRVKTRNRSEEWTSKM